MTAEQIRKDLAEIRCYYAMEKSFIKGSAIVKNHAIAMKINKYSDAISKAPPKLYILYMGLYADNNTQESLAKLWNFSEANIRYYKKQLCDYLTDYFDKQS